MPANCLDENLSSVKKSLPQVGRPVWGAPYQWIQLDERFSGAAGGTFF